MIHRAFFFRIRSRTCQFRADCGRIMALFGGSDRAVPPHTQNTRHRKVCSVSREGRAPAPSPFSHKCSPQTGPAREVPAPPSARGAEKPPHLFSSFQEFPVLPACTLPTISVLRSEISSTSVTIASEIMMRNNFEAAMDRALGRAGACPSRFTSVTLNLKSGTPRQAWQNLLAERS